MHIDKAGLPSTALGLAMAAAAGFQTVEVASAVAIMCALVVVVGTRSRRAASVAVLLAAAAVMLSNAPLLQAGLVGLCAAHYLALRHCDLRRTRLARRWVTLSAATLVTVVAVSAASLPITLPWLPLLAAPTVFVAYLLAVRPFLTGIALLQQPKRAFSDGLRLRQRERAGPQ